MKRLLKWFSRIIASVLTLILVILALPYASRFLSSMLPDLSGAATNLSVTLSRHMQEAARLETSIVEDEGVLESSTNALFLGEVQKVTIRYTYRASIGIDLTKVQLSVSGNTITMELPALEVLSDSLTPEEIIRDDFWYPLTDERLQKLLSDEQTRCRAHYLAENAQSAAAWSNTVAAMENTIGQWIGLGRSGVSIEFIPATAHE